MGTFGVDANGEATSGLNYEGESTDATPRDGAPRMSNEVRETGGAKGVRVVGPGQSGQPVMGGAGRTRQNRTVLREQKSWKPISR